MHGTSKYKIPGGKLVEIRLDYDKKIGKVEILGDFFLYPEESISLIEEGLKAANADESEKDLADRIQSIAEKSHIEMIGVTPEGIAKAIKMAIGK